VKLLRRVILLLFIILTVSAFSFVLNNFAGLKIFPSYSFTISLNLSNYTETSRLVISISNPNSTFTLIRLDTSKPEHGNIIELTPKDYNYKILSFNNSVSIFGVVEVAGLSPRSWYYVKVCLPINFTVKPYILLTGALRYGETYHLEFPMGYDSTYVGTSYFWVSGFTSDDGVLAFNFMVVASST
jgi:hypothetical protein